MLENEGWALYDGVPGLAQTCASQQGFYGEFVEDLLYQIFRQIIRHFFICLALLCFAFYVLGSREKQESKQVNWEGRVTFINGCLVCIKFNPATQEPC
jgi:hypothetical protein